jgi:hypothetical protein
MEALLTPSLEIRSLGNSLTLADSNTDEKRLPPFGLRLKFYLGGRFPRLVNNGAPHPPMASSEPNKTTASFECMRH